jgi:ATP-dependent helicase HrpA
MNSTGLPIDAHRDELLTAITDHQVVIVAGETGSGKSTQLPQLCLALGRGVEGRLIGHTQPRRVAARTIAERVAEELGTELGHTVGYTVRFTDRVGEHTRVKVMTDGILLAEIQRDRMLRRYDTLIIDEAHERSLNIDFLLGYLKQLLPKRPDLKIIITSATIDTERFSRHFDAPVIEVSGRSYPVELRYRPFGSRPDEPGDDRDQVQAVLDAVDELGREGRGDVLVFLSGEREIHDVSDALRRQNTERGGHVEVLPLYARLSAVEQHRIFQPHSGRRVVLSTNVAETSLTVPGVRYVVDAGTARISRYSHRLKVQRLPIEPVSQASANQRAGRCGRVAPGICIRLYDEAEFTARTPFTEPEILRTNLASVILQMTALGLGEVEAFPFLDPPDPRSVRDGYALLHELGAIDGQRLTPLGRRLARLPIDPRLGRMVLEAERHGCVREVLIIASALSIQDPREHPAEQKQAADDLHRRFIVKGSDFLGFVALWDHLREQQQQRTNSQFRRMCKDEFLHYVRVREWQDLFSQLRQVAGQLGIRQGSEQGHPDRVHQAVLAGLLSHLGMREAVDGTKRSDYRGAHGSRFALGRSSSVAAAQPKWVVAAELVETNRLWGHVVAEVKPEWAERLGSHIAKRSYGDPWWDTRRGGAVCREQVTLYGLPIVNRTVGYDRVDPAAAREYFIRCALVEGDWTTHHAFWRLNREFLDGLVGMAERLRRPDLGDDEAVFAFYDRRVGPDVVTTRHFDRWWKDARAADPQLLTMRLEHFTDSTSTAATDGFPGTWRHGEIDLDVTYRFDPGAPDDGATVHVPVAALNQIDDRGFDWQVPGFRADLVDALLRSLPKDYRRELTPMAEVVTRVVAALRPATDALDEPLTAALARTVRAETGTAVPPRAFQLDRAPAHLRVTFAVHDQQGRVLASGKHLADLRSQLATAVRRSIADASPIDERRGITTWDVGDLPTSVEMTRNGLTLRGYPALLDDGDSVSLRVLTSPGLQAKVMHGGVRRLLLLAVPVGKRAVGRDTSTSLLPDCCVAAADAVIHRHGELPYTQAAFEALLTAARDALPTEAARLLKLANEVRLAATAVRTRLDRLVAPPVAASAADARAQLERLTRDGFVRTAGPTRLADLVRYVKAIDLRLTKLPEAPQKDAANLREVAALERRYTELLRRTARQDVTAEMVDVGWMLEELRVAVFAQTLGAAKGTSAARVSKALVAMGA